MTTIAPQTEPIRAVLRRSDPTRYDLFLRGVGNDLAELQADSRRRVASELVGVCPNCGHIITPGDQRESIERPER